MKRKSNISVWQLGLFEALDRDIMVMQRDEDEIFDGAIHVFFDKGYYDAYVALAVKYSGHAYAYHEDKLGEVIKQIFDEDIPGLALHIVADGNAPQNVVCDEKYIAADDLLVLRDAADSYHHMYIAHTDRCPKEEAVARLWMKNVFIIGRVPDMKALSRERQQPGHKHGKKPGQNQIFEFMTMKRKNDGSQATQDDYDYESLKVFLTADSAMRFNPDKRPVNRYKLAMLSQLVKGKLHIIIEPHRGYWLEYDPAKLDLKGLLDVPVFNEGTVRERIREYAQMEKMYILLAPLQSDYRVSLGAPLILKADDKNVIIYLFEKYDDAVSFVLQNPNLLPVLGGVFPIGMLGSENRLHRLDVLLSLAEKIGVTGVNLDFDTPRAISCRIGFMRDAAEFSARPEELLDAEWLSQVKREHDGRIQYRMPSVPFCDTENEYPVDDARKAELLAHMDNDFDNGFTYMSGCRGLTEMMFMLQESAVRYENARKADDAENKEKYNRMMNRITVIVTETLCELPYIYALHDEDGGFVRKNNIPYLVVTDRYESGRGGGGRLVPAGIDNPQFMEKLCEAGSVAALTDGPGVICLMDTKFMREVAKQWKAAEPFRAEMMVFMTQGCGLSYAEAGYYYRRLRSENSIFVEFASAFKSGAYPEIGMLTIEGFTAEKLAMENGLDMVRAYDTLLRLKEDASYAKELRGADSGKPEDAEPEGTAVKKGIWGKLFGK